MSDYSYEEFEKYYTKFIEIVSASFSEEILTVSKEDFFKLAGSVTEDDASFEQRLSWFLEWFVFEFSQNGKTPGRLFLEKYDKLTELERKIYSDFMNFLHGIFYVMKTSRCEATVQELFTEKSIRLIIPEGSMAFRKGSLFQGSIFSFMGNYYVSPVVLFHPDSVSKIVMKAIKGIRNRDAESKEQLFWMVAKWKLKQERWTRLSPEDIYRQGLKELGN